MTYKFSKSKINLWYGSEQEQKQPSIKDRLAANLEKAKSSGHLLRIAKGILMSNPVVVEKMGPSAYGNLPWIGFSFNGGNYLVRFDSKMKFESLFLTKYLEGDKVESTQIVNDGTPSAEENFEGVSYLLGREHAKDFVDELTHKQSWEAEYGESLIGEQALPHAKRLLGELL